MMATFDVFNGSSEKITACLTADEVCATYRIDPLELAWAVEEFGMCTIANDGGEEFRIVPHGELPQRE